jgi:phytoene synthase
MIDDPLERGTPPGSLRQLAVMYAPRHARTVLRALYAFEAEIDDTVRAANHDIAHTRLQWWRGEIDRLLAGNAQHPITRALSPVREFAPDELPALHELLVAADFDIARMAFQDDRELAAFFARAGGAVQTLAAIASRGSSHLTADEHTFASRLGVAIERTERLRDLRPHVMAGRLPFSLAALDEAGVSPRDLQATALTPAVEVFLEGQRRAIDSELADSMQILPPRDRPAQRQGLVLGALHRALAARVTHGGELARAPAQVAVWTRVWVAWRTAVQCR